MIIVNMSWLQFENACQQIASQVPSTITDIYGIPRGGLVLAVRLSHMLNKPLIRDEWLISRTTLVCDDISDTGETLSELLPYNVFKFKIATLVYRPKSKIKPDFYVYEKGDKYVNFPWEKDTSRLKSEQEVRDLYKLVDEEYLRKYKNHKSNLSNWTASTYFKMALAWVLGDINTLPELLVPAHTVEEMLKRTREILPEFPHSQQKEET